MQLEEVTKLAFVDELTHILSARGQPVPDLLKMASTDYFYELIKEAKFLKALKGLGASAKKALPQSGTAKFMQAAEKEGLGDVASKALKKSRPSERLSRWGKQQRMTPVERMQSAGHKLAPGEGAQITKATEAMGGSTLGKRMVGGTAEGVGSHVAHKSGIGIATNPLGIPLGGALEGAVRQTGRELHRKGATRVGSALQKHAPKAGFAGEMAGLAAAGTALHAPLNAAAAVGKGAVGYIAPKATGYLGHLAADVIGTSALRAGGAATARAIPYAARAAPYLRKAVMGA